MYNPNFDSSFQLQNSKTNVIEILGRHSQGKMPVCTLLTVTNNMWFGYLVKNTSKIKI